MKKMVNTTSVTIAASLLRKMAIADSVLSSPLERMTTTPLTGSASPIQVDARRSARRRRTTLEINRVQAASARMSSHGSMFDEGTSAIDAPTHRKDTDHEAQYLLRVAEA